MTSDNRVGAIASALSRDFATRCDNSSVFKIHWEQTPNGEIPTGYHYVGDANDARYGQLVGQPGYIQISTTRGDIIAQAVARS